MTPPPDACPECDIPMHGDTCRHCGYEIPEPEPPEGWLHQMRETVKRARQSDPTKESK